MSGRGPTTTSVRTRSGGTYRSMAALKFPAPTVQVNPGNHSVTITSNAPGPNNGAQVGVHPNPNGKGYVIYARGAIVSSSPSVAGVNSFLHGFTGKANLLQPDASGQLVQRSAATQAAAKAARASAQAAKAQAAAAQAANPTTFYPPAGVNKTGVPYPPTGTPITSSKPLSAAQKSQLANLQNQSHSPQSQVSHYTQKLATAQQQNNQAQIQYAQTKLIQAQTQVNQLLQLQTQFHAARAASATKAAASRAARTPQQKAATAAKQAATRAAKTAAANAVKQAAAQAAQQRANAAAHAATVAQGKPTTPQGGLQAAIAWAQANPGLVRGIPSGQTTYSVSGGNNATKDIAAEKLGEAMGFAATPHLANQYVIDSLIQSHGAMELYRGFSSSKGVSGAQQHAHSMMSGPYRPSLGVHGTGYYVGVGYGAKGIAQGYGPVVTRMALVAGAKVGSASSLQSSMTSAGRAFISSHQPGATNQQQAPTASLPPLNAGKTWATTLPAGWYMRRPATGPGSRGGKSAAAQAALMTYNIHLYNYRQGNTSQYPSYGIPSRRSSGNSGSGVRAMSAGDQAVYKMLYTDVGRYAISKGYDAVNANGSYMIVLNRAAMVVQDTFV